MRAQFRKGASEIIRNGSAALLRGAQRARAAFCRRMKKSPTCSTSTYRAPAERRKHRTPDFSPGTGALSCPSRTELGLSVSTIARELDEVEQRSSGKEPARIICASRGEYLNGLLLADYLGFALSGSQRSACSFNDDGTFDSERTNDALAEKLNSRASGRDPRLSTAAARDGRSPHLLPRAAATFPAPSWRARPMRRCMKTGRT